MEEVEQTGGDGDGGRVGSGGDEERAVGVKFGGGEGAGRHWIAGPEEVVREDFAGGLFVSGRDSGRDGVGGGSLVGADARVHLHVGVLDVGGAVAGHGAVN